MAKNFSYDARRAIRFTEDDIAVGIGALTKAERVKSIATLNLDYVAGSALKHFADLANSLKGVVKNDYNTLTVVVPLDRDELRDAALRNLRYSEAHAELRELRAEEQEIMPEPPKAEPTDD